MQPHLQLRKGQVSPVVIVVGDPQRVEQIAEFCDSHEQLASFREYRTFRCVYKRAEFTVTSHGVGAPGAAICFEELIALGAKVIIRAGTAGSLQPSIKQGDIVVCYSAAREEGVSALHVPPGYPAAAEPEIFEAIRNTAKDIGETVKCGMCLSSDLFYKPKCLPSTLETFSRANVDCVEMEAATLFVIARVRGIKAGALVTIDGSPLRFGMGDFDPQGPKVSEGKERMIRIAIETAAKLSAQYPAAAENGASPATRAV